MYLPSGVNSGDVYRLSLPFVISTVSRLSRDSVQRLSPPLRSDTKTIFFPSGLNRGWLSIAMPLVRRVAVPPAIGSVYRSPRRSKTIVWPSGLTSSDIHDALLVVKFT